MLINNYNNDDSDDTELMLMNLRPYSPPALRTEKSCVQYVWISTGIWLLKACWKQNPVTFQWRCNSPHHWPVRKRPLYHSRLGTHSAPCEWLQVRHMAAAVSHCTCCTLFWPLHKFSTRTSTSDRGAALNLLSSTNQPLKCMKAEPFNTVNAKSDHPRTAECNSHLHIPELHNFL